MRIAHHYFIYIFFVCEIWILEKAIFTIKKERERERERGICTGLVWIILLKPYHCQITERNYLNKNANQGCVTFLFLFFEITVVEVIEECYVHNTFITNSK